MRMGARSALEAPAAGVCTVDGRGFRDVHGRWEGSKTTALMPLIVNYTANDLSGISDAEVAAKEPEAVASCSIMVNEMCSARARV